jgi:hypothetical protein
MTLNSLQVDHVLNDHNGRKIAIALININFGEQKAQSCAIAWFRQLSDRDF